MREDSIWRWLIGCVLQEEQFANEFLQRDGLKELIDVISVSHGNTLAVGATRCHQNILY